MSVESDKVFVVYRVVNLNEKEYLIFQTIMENLDNYELTEEQKKFLRTRKPANQLQRRMKQ